MLAIKFKRVGKKHQGSFRVVVLEKRTKLNGRFTDDLGWLDPHTDKFELDKKKAQHWLSVGAQPTPTVHNFLIKAGVLSGKKIAVHKQPKKKEGEEAPSSAKVTDGKVATAPAA
jgi:small subunit ribosomal protein S16